MLSPNGIHSDSRVDKAGVLPESTQYRGVFGVGTFVPAVFTGLVAVLAYIATIQPVDREDSIDPLPGSGLVVKPERLPDTGPPCGRESNRNGIRAVKRNRIRGHLNVSVIQRFH